MIILVYMKNSQYHDSPDYDADCQSWCIDNSKVPMLVLVEDKAYAGLLKTTYIPLESIYKYEILEDMPKEKINET